MPRCLVVQEIHPAGLDILRAAGIGVVRPASDDPADVLPLVGDVDAAITRNRGLSAEAIGRARRLRVIGVHGTGTDAVPIDLASRRGILVFNTPGRNDRSVAEHALALLLALAKSVVAADGSVRAGDTGFRYRARPVELAGLTLGVAGFGRIGRLVADLAAGFGMEVLVWSRHVAPSEIVALGYRAAPGLDDLLAGSDAVSLHLSLTEETRGVIDAAALRRMRAGTFLVNTARGALIDEADLVAALRNGHLGGAALDVTVVEPLPPDSPLLGCPGLVLTPHLAGSTSAALERTAVAVATGVVEALSGRDPPHPVNLRAIRGSAP
jgi:D-3-phosphoglycerate dehydrogenase